MRISVAARSVKQVRVGLQREQALRRRLEDTLSRAIEDGVQAESRLERIAERETERFLSLCAGEFVCLTRAGRDSICPFLTQVVNDVLMKKEVEGR